VNARFTIDGSDALERQLEQLCSQVLLGVQQVVTPRKLEALVLGGGYGRGEGGVLETDQGHQPYNDLEFYVFLRGPRLWNQRQFGSGLAALGESLSQQAGLHVEFKIDSLERLRSEPISMFSYDLVSAHRIIFGLNPVFSDCSHHLAASRLPLSEATRLLFNRCSGLLLVRDMLRQPNLDSEQSDFVGRNLAKARLALGDAALVALHQYHWSARTRATRLADLDSSESAPELPALRQHHAQGLEFKFHPRKVSRTVAEFVLEHQDVSGLAAKIWLWIEGRRLRQPFASMREYAFSASNKCPETLGVRNRLLTMKTFGPSAALDAMATRYPRERLFNSLPLLLWNGEVSREPDIQRHLQKQLRTSASDWEGLVAAYKEVWPSYG
jgi:hypothetical protein